MEKLFKKITEEAFNNSNKETIVIINGTELTVEIDTKNSEASNSLYFTKYRIFNEKENSINISSQQKVKEIIKFLEEYEWITQ